MSVLYVALPVAILMGAAAVVACIYCIRGGQFDDLDSPPVRMLIDDEVSSGQPLESESSDTATAEDPVSHEPAESANRHSDR